MASHSAIRLPHGLLAQIGPSSENTKSTPGRGPHRGARPSRKEARKQDRNAKKQRKATHFAAAATSSASGVVGGSAAKRPAAAADHPASPKRKKAKVARDEDAPPVAGALFAGPPAVKEAPGVAASARAPPKTKLEKLAARADPVLRTRAEEHEDRYIALLEGKLGALQRGKRLGAGLAKEFEEDGLGDLLMDLDSIGASSSRNKLDAFPHSPSADEEDEGDEDEDEDGAESEGAESTDYIDEEWSGFGESIEHSAGEDTDEAPPLLPDPAASKPAPVAGSAYVPPHLRKADAQNSEALTKLTRQLKGLLNRMSEQNIAAILDDVEEAYRKHRRHDVTSCLTSLITEGIAAHSILLDSYVVLHAAFVSSLHKIVGVEFAAYFVQHVVALYERHYDTLRAEPGGAPAGPGDESETRGKECSNLIVLLSELYNFQVISCVLVYDVIRSLLDGALDEFRVELLLKLLRSSGQQLRQDDPSALKDIIQIVQGKTSGDQQSSSSRTRFMVETLVNLKNNKTKRSATQHAGGDAVERMKKFLTGLSKKRQVAAHDPLRVSLDDLHSAETKGKWWLVGAAWGGDPLLEQQQASANRDGGAAPPETASESSLVKLARKQGMNTDIRRSVFVVLMSSDDYVDACERLAQLNLTEIQQREIVRVLLHCCGNEKSYNPYYTFVGQHLCRSSHSYKVTLQFCLWDFLRDLGETNVGGAEVIKNLKDDAAVGFDVKKISSSRMRNVARAYAWWVAKDAITLAVFKPVDFMAIKPQTRAFLKEFCMQLFVSSQSSVPVLTAHVANMPSTRNRGPLQEVFARATRVQALAVGLVYFLTDAFRRADGEGGGGGSDGNFVTWARDVAVDTLRTGLDTISTL